MHEFYCGNGYMKTQIFDDQFIVITGAAGFIGSGIVRHLNDKGFFNLVLVDNFDKGDKWKNLRHKRFAEFIAPEDLFDFLEGREQDVEAFVHLGACSDVTETDGDYMFHNNYRFSIDLAEYALENSHRFIYASSAATYGDGSLGFADDVTQLDALCALNLYGFSKHMFDKWLYEQNVLDQVVGLKYFNIFGPNEGHKGRMTSMVTHMVNQIQKTGRVKLFKSTDPKRFKDGEQCRDFFYVKDAVKMTALFLDHDLNGIFNVGSGDATTWNELAEFVFDALGEKKQIEYIPLPEDLKGCYQNYTRADMTKFYRTIKEKNITYLPDFTLKSAIEDYVNIHLLKGVEW